MDGWTGAIMQKPHVQFVHTQSNNEKNKANTSKSRAVAETKR